MLYLFFVLVVVAVIVFFLKKPQKQVVSSEQTVSADVIDYGKRELFTETEAKFYHTLCEVLPSGYKVWGKLGLWAVVSSKKGWNKISKKQLDFVILKDTGALIPEVVLVVELDDYTHSRKSAMARDAEKDAILAASGIPVLRVRVQSAYDSAALRSSILQFVSLD